MTTGALVTAAPGPGRETFIVRARTETVIPGTPLVVWHDGDGNATVSVLHDGALDLIGASYWIVGLASTWQGAES